MKHMQLRYVDVSPEAHPTPLLAIGVFDGASAPDGSVAALDGALGGALSQALERGDMKGRSGDELLLYGSGTGPERVLLLGLGKREGFDLEGVRRMAARLVRAAERLGLEEGAVALDGLEGLDGLDAENVAQAAAEGATLAAWRFTELKAPDAERPVVPVRAADLIGKGDAEASSRGVLAGAAIGRGETLARTLQSRPGNVATPTHLA